VLSVLSPLVSGKDTLFVVVVACVCVNLVFVNMLTLGLGNAHVVVMKILF